MKKWLFLLMSVLIAGALPADQDWRHQAKEPIDRRLSLDKPGDPVALEVDNIFGSITVKAADVSEVALTGIRLDQAESPGDLKKAREEVKLEIGQTDNQVRIYVNGPFRERHDRGDDRRYLVRFDFTLTVPRRTTVRLKTVTDGDIRLSGTEGRFQVDNVNGAVFLERIAGDGRAATVNGRVRADFRRAPAQPCEFHTVNGDIDLSYPDGLNADIRFKTVNGEAWSDFECTARAAQPPVGEPRNGRGRIIGDRYRNLRIGQGGPLLTMETVNGDMTIARIDAKSVKTGE